MINLVQAARQALEAFALLDAIWYQGANMNTRVVERKMYAAMDALNQQLLEPPPREWVGLTEEEISAIAKKLFGFAYDAAADRPFARAIEAKLKELNT